MNKDSQNLIVAVIVTGCLVCFGLGFALGWAVFGLSW